ncbi:unnamed protein product [Paramecium sonneborni]|uniref:EGF-like domain-containing protein n=1 Tax=Paramecium sonneborni TaxID=65129 RepID=A0A8S1PZH4_9CILI|nr:unnamed protein product [Paramecium sonneborni]
MSCEFTPNNCTSCSSDQFRVLNLSSKTCNCQSGYLEIDGICQQCHQSCSTCSQSINNCAACDQFRYLKNNKCICNEGMYESIQDKQCKLCNKTCLTCTYTSDYCLTCSIDNHRIFKSGNICECEQGYFENPITQNCLECDKSCLTCSLQFDNCLSCDSSFKLSLVNNKCLCSQSYYFDSSTKQCLQCNITCLECNNNIQCILCRGTTRHFDSDTKKCICNQGYYETNEQNCQQCHFSCETCENTNNHCLSCLDIYNRILTNNQCLCKDGYYEVGFELCQKCNNICKTCLSTSTNCLSCYDIEQFRFLLGDKCFCNPGYFESGSDICLKCSNQCKTCQGQDDYCTSCDIDSKRVDQSIIHKCPCIVGFYEDQNKICQKCHIKCQTCINQSGQCLSCKVFLNSNRNNLSDLCNCKQGYYDDGTQIQCQKCNFKCQTCENEENNCLVCQNSIRVNPPSCNCMDGYYEDEQQICQICASQCHTCILQESNCLICREGRIGKDCRCFDGYFEFGSLLCEKCAFQCASCDSSQQNCKTCKGDRIQEPQCICQPGYFDDLLNENCQKCNSFCLECNIDGCLSCNANRILNEEMDCIPPPNSVWYDHTPWCSTCQIAVVKTYLSDDISKIIIRFDFPLNPKGFYSQIQINKCLQLFELETTKSFGNNAVCYLNPDDFQELFITLGENSSINVGDEILFQSNSLSHINCGTTLQKFFFTTLQMPINPIPPQIQYNVPPHLLNPYAENLVHVNQISNNGNRKLKNILWSYEAEDNEKRETLNQFLDQNNLIQDYNLFIPKFTLPPNSLIKFKIQYQNFIHIKSFSEFTLLTHSGEYPQININLKPYYFVFEQISVSLSVGTLNQSNLQDNSRYQIQIFEKDRQPKKTTSSHINISIQSNPFETIFTNISKYTLSPNTTYTFQVNSTNLMTSKSQIQQFKIHIPFAGLTCKFNNREIQSIRQDLNLQIKCKDLDTRYDWNNDPDLYIQVSCKDLSLNNTCKNQQKQTIHVNATDFIQFIKKNSMSTFIVQEWTVNVTKFSQSSKFNLIIVYLEDNFPSLELEYNQGYYMRKVNNFEQLNFTFLIPLTQKRYLLDLSIAIIYNYEIIEILQPQYTSHNFKIFNSIKELNFGDTINLKFSAQYTNNIMPSLNNIKLNINQPPICSKLFIIRSNDLALTNIQVATICEQSNDFPYKYQLRLFLRESDLTEFQKENQIIPYQNQFQIQIPTSIDQSIVGILVSVLDNGGSMSHIFDKVTVKPAKLDCSQIQFQNLTLQNKISLLFESMNQKCDQLHYLIYLDLHYQQIFPNTNENTLKFQAIKLYKQFLYQLPSNQSQNRLLSEETQIKCFDLKSNHLFITSNSTYTVVNLTKKIENLQQENDKLDIALIYFSEMKRKCLEELNVNQFMWNEEIFQKYQTSQDGLLTLLYYIDDIYSDFSKVNTKNETIYKNIVKLLKDINLILEEIQNVVIVNQSPLVLKGKEIFFYIKRRTKQQFNQQFNIESTQEDYLVDFVQSDSIQLRTNPNRFTLELEKNLQKEFNDQTLKIYNQDYYLIQLKNYLKNRFISLENFIAIYSTTFESYQVCSNNIQNQQEYEIKCMLKTMSGNFSLCNLIKIQNNDTIDIRCECNKFGEIFIITSSNFSKVILNNSDQQMFDLVFGTTNLLAIIIFSSILTLTFMTIYILFLLKDCSNKQESLNTEEIIPNTSKSNIDKKRLLYEGCFKVFIANVKLIHQSLSIFYYQDKYINLSYRILEIFSQFNLLLTLTIVECYVFNNSIIFIILFIIANPFIILILRILYKIIKAIYRFKRIAAFISQLLLILLLVIPNLVLFIFQLFNISVKSEQYEVAIIFLGSLLFSQIFVEPLIILVRIIIYRLIAPSIDQKELNPYIHLIHFFIMHSSLEDIFDNFTRI